MDDRRYKIMNESTTGWVLIDDKAQNLTKQECDKWINDLLIGIQNFPTASSGRNLLNQ